MKTKKSKKNNILIVALAIISFSTTVANAQTTTGTENTDVYAYNESVSEDAVIFEPIALTPEYFSFLINGSYALADYIMQYALTIHDYSGSLSLRFNIDNVDTTFVVANVNAESKYLVNLTFTTTGIHFINDATRKTTLLTQAGPSKQVSTSVDIMGNFEKFTDINVAYVGLTNIVSPCIKEMRISPNPATDFITISGLQISEMFYIYNINGQRLFSGKATNETEQVAVDHLPAGIYFVKTSNGQTSKWVKK